MRVRVILGLAFVSTVVLAIAAQQEQARPPQKLVRIAELAIDPAQLNAYTAALREEIAESVRSEPGVLNLYAVSLREQPTQIRIFEIYASRDAYLAHLQTPHFKKYKSATEKMVQSLRLIEADPILLGAQNYSKR